jgi:small redox-active disulfide protein 2
MKLEILGAGCANCQKLYKLTEEAVAELGLSGVELSKVEDFPAIMAYGVMTTPALAVDGKVVLSGRVPARAELVSVLTSAAAGA